jgi:hypothetical protein
VKRGCRGEGKTDQATEGGDSKPARGRKRTGGAELIAREEKSTGVKQLGKP